MEIIVYYEDTDCGGVVYYANYLKYFERARTQFFLDRNMSLAEYQKKGVLFTVVSAAVNYRSPAFYGDLLYASTIIEGVKGSSFMVHYTIRRKPQQSAAVSRPRQDADGTRPGGILVAGGKKDDTVIVTGATRMACVSGDMKPIRMPPEIREALTLSDSKRKM
jgi:acyl-CoA thioester hydrolase